MYKDRHKTDASDSAQSGPMFVDYVPDTTMTKRLLEILNKKILLDKLVRHSPTPVLRRSTSPHVPNKRYMNYLLLTDEGEPECYDEACLTTDASKWDLAMKDEMQSLISN
ncbi:hypothetical protein LIER_14582 [Lithospermum erythrorhizon]|uniref:Uncharacterized protein n=1 Tax=Lithospermum erythrorhizon TaxID=34254 RepID=A0AAV3PZM5_LITER